MDGIELNIRFATKPNELKYCGPNCASSDFAKYLKDKSNREDVEKSIGKFEALPVYLSAIAKKNNLDFFDYRVAEAYWIGNELLNKFTVSDMKNIIDQLVQRGMPQSEAERLKSRLVPGFVPHHIFHVFFVEIGKTSGKIEPLFKFKETCRPSFGKVKEILEDKLIVDRIPIVNGDKYSFGSEIGTEVSYVKEFTGEVLVGDYVGVHWDCAVLKLNKMQAKNIQKYNSEFIELFNSIN